MTETATIVGISDEHLVALLRGRWVDDDSPTPGWQRMTLGEGDRRRRVLQWVYPDDNRTVWKARDAAIGPALGITDRFSNLDKALKYCDDRASNREISSPSGITTNQADRFVRKVDYRKQRQQLRMSSTNI